MCTYSAMVDQFGPKIFPQGAVPMPGYNPTPLLWPPAPAQVALTADQLKEILDIGKRLDRIDKALGLKDCSQEDAAKRAFEAKLEALIRQAQELKDGGSQAIITSSSNHIDGYGGPHTVGFSPGGIAQGSSPWITVGHGSAQSTKGLQST